MIEVIAALLGPVVCGMWAALESLKAAQAPREGRER